MNKKVQGLGKTALIEVTEDDTQETLRKKVEQLRGPMPEYVGGPEMARILGISPALFNYLVCIGVFTQVKDPNAVPQPVPEIIGTRDAMRLISVTDKKTFYKRVRLGFYRSFGPNMFNPAMLVADHESYMKSDLPMGDHRSHSAKY